MVSWGPAVGNMTIHVKVAVLHEWSFFMSVQIQKQRLSQRVTKLLESPCFAW